MTNEDRSSRSKPPLVSHSKFNRRLSKIWESSVLFINWMITPWNSHIFIRGTSATLIKWKSANSTLWQTPLLGILISSKLNEERFYLTVTTGRYITQMVESDRPKQRLSRRKRGTRSIASESAASKQNFTLKKEYRVSESSLLRLVMGLR